MYASLACIILGSVLLLVLDLKVTGTSYQLGRVCYINPYKGWGTFWIPLLVIAGLDFTIPGTDHGILCVHCLAPDMA